MYTNPTLFDQDSGSMSLERMPLDKGFNEEWLQKRLFESPKALPFGEIDPGFVDVVPLCMEMSTSAGPIDIVYITPHGKIIVVETKLFRNPEARRKVVGQILDYAKELTEWSYGDLQREVTKRTGIKGNSPYQLVKELYPNTDEATFVDGVSRSLAEGDFMLIIAGDGIKQGAKGIVDFLQNTAHMRFVIAMMEVAVFRIPSSKQYIIQPRLLVSSETIERYYEGIESTPKLSVTKSTESNALDYQPYWNSFLDKLSIDDPEQPFPNANSKPNIFFPLPPGANTAWITVYFSKTDKEVGCFVRISKSPEGNELFQQLLAQQETINDNLNFEVTWDDSNRRIKRKLKISDDWPPFKNPEIEPFFKETINEMVNVFRPLLKELTE